MEQDEKNLSQDIALEPVDLTQDDAYMDTGVLHDDRICVDCKEKKAAKGHNKCAACLEKA